MCERAPAALVTVAGEEPREHAIASGRSGGHREPAGRGRSGAGAASEHSAERRSGAAAAGPRGQGRSGQRRLLPRARRLRGRYARRWTWVKRACCVRSRTPSCSGRGGAAFPTGRKWDAVARNPKQPHYLICNADESEPGTFKDRVLLEHDPFFVIESMTIGGFATGAEHGYLYLRGEYPVAWERLVAAITEARARGFLGQDILGRGVSFDIELRKGAGAYICGEETALFNSIEGYRGEPRNKPPFPVDTGTVRHADGHQQRRDARQRAGDPRSMGPRRTPRSAQRTRPARACSACPGASPARASTRRRSGSRCARFSRWPAG